MREIKFRAWDTKDKAMRSPVTIQVLSRMSLSYEIAYDYLFEQFTGLHDKNGKEIYEGDFVYIAGSGVDLIEWPFFDLYDAAAEKDIGEIKGNIHENPELLQPDNTEVII